MSTRPHTTHMQILTVQCIQAINTATTHTPFTYPHTDSMIHDVQKIRLAYLQTTTRQTRDQAEVIAWRATAFTGLASSLSQICKLMDTHTVKMGGANRVVQQGLKTLALLQQMPLQASLVRLKGIVIRE